MNRVVRWIGLVFVVGCVWRVLSVYLWWMGDFRKEFMFGYQTKVIVCLINGCSFCSMSSSWKYEFI